ncbi:MAG: uridine kinase [Bacteroidales bacterium]|nr:uridine kinase [Bacteroidales bacterium]MCF8332780.1 uridine kinase [Bacteroidales bacterium]
MLIIGIAGGSGSGKTTVAKKIIEGLPEESISIIPQDAYYKDNSHLPIEERKTINFDHPSSIEFELLVEHVDKLISGQSIQMPVYSYVTCSRKEETITIEPTKVVIVEGILILTNPELRKRLGIKIFVDADSDNRLMRILVRDKEERGRSYDEVIEHYQSYVQPMHLQFIEPSKKFADIIVPEGGRNHIAIDILRSRICQNIEL